MHLHLILFTMATDIGKLRFRPTNHSKNDECVRSSYTYKPLQTTTSIRVLKIHPPDIEAVAITLEELANIKIKASLVEVDLNDAPVFNALSYTWGDPVVYRFKDDEILAVKDWYCQCHSIECDGQAVTVGANLFSGLFEMRYLRSYRSSRHSNTDWKDLLDCPIWIDALCINQNDPNEKVTQIPLMGRIYSQAEHTVAYLGAADDASVTVMPFIQSFVRAISAYKKQVPGGHIFDLIKGSGSAPQVTGKLLQKYKIPIIPGDAVPHFYAFCTRAWFMRTWVMQEIALSRHTMLLCGGMSIDMRDFSSFFRDTRHITGFSHIPTVDSQGNLEPWWDWKGESRSLLNCPKELRCREGQEQPLWAIWSTAFDIKEQDEFRGDARFMLPVLPRPMSQLITKFRRTGAADPRDRIYGVLSLEKDGWGPQKRIARPPLSYSKPLADIYVEWTRYILRSEQDLAYLGLADNDPDRQRGVQSGVPSWVPNLVMQAVTGGPVNQDLLGTGCPFSTMLAVGPLHLSFPDESTLKLRGRRIGAVAAVHDFAGSKRTGTIFDHARLLLDLPTYTWVPNVQPTIELRDFHLKSFLLYKHSFEDAESRMKESEEKAEAGTFQSRYEVYWRTLLMDQCDRRHPAPENAGPILMSQGQRLLADFLLECIRNPQKTSSFETFLFFLDVWVKLHKPGELRPADEFTEGDFKELVGQLDFYEDIFTRYVIEGIEDTAQDVYDKVSLDVKLTSGWLLPMLEKSGFIVGFDTDSMHHPDVLLADPNEDLVLVGRETYNDEQTRLKQMWKSKSSQKDDGGGGSSSASESPQVHMSTEPPIQYSSRFDTNRIDMKDVWEQSMKVVTNRALVRLDNGFLGLGHYLSQVGDEVWALAGSRVPFTLRKEISDATVDEYRYRLIGEAYVHGIMHGDAIEEDKMGDVQYVHII